MTVDPYKFAHWMNVRKMTPLQVARASGVPEEAVRGLARGDAVSVSDAALGSLCRALRIDREQLHASSRGELSAIVVSADDVRGSCRPIRRDGIHFYNYYSLPGPPGRVAPVILDILCPADRVPALNNGHLEPAITVNLGPGPINGRWGEHLGNATWRVLSANDGDDEWIVGDSYVEPSYCPHSYSLASDVPARIVSYTCESNLAPLFEEVNEWGNTAFDALLADVGDGDAAHALRSALRRRGFDTESAASVSEVPAPAMDAFIAGDARALGIDDMKALGRALGFDYRTLLPPTRRHDEVGKTCCSVIDSRSTIRTFGRYTVASMASAPHLPDLTGLFMRVDDDETPLDVCDAGDSHYLVLSGEVALAWRNGRGDVERADMTKDAAAWIGPYVEHGLAGRGAVVKLGSGRHVGYLDRIELSNTFSVRATLGRGRRDAVGWGYDPVQSAVEMQEATSAG